MFREPPLRLLTLVIGAVMLLPAMSMALGTDVEPMPTPTSRAAVALATRAERLTRTLDSFVARYRQDALPIERALYAYRPDADSGLVRRVTGALIRHARENDIEPQLLAGVLLVENPWLKPDTASFVGAMGLMQVMPFHAGRWGCRSDDLTDIEANICHGARILARNIDQSNGNIERALLRYNGCVNGTNTPDCHRYPSHVLRAVRRVKSHAVAMMTDPTQTGE